MQGRLDTGIGLVQPPRRALWRSLWWGAAALAQGWRRLVGEPYRPEKHYMRGPGPKWRAKYAETEARRRTGVARTPQDATRGG
jgi:hypothetical protein